MLSSVNSDWFSTDMRPQHLPGPSYWLQVPHPPLNRRSNSIAGCLNYPAPICLQEGLGDRDSASLHSIPLSYMNRNKQPRDLLSILSWPKSEGKGRSQPYPGSSQALRLNITYTYKIYIPLPFNAFIGSHYFPTQCIKNNYFIELGGIKSVTISKPPGACIKQALP